MLWLFRKTHRIFTFEVLIAASQQGGRQYMLTQFTHQNLYFFSIHTTFTGSRKTAREISHILTNWGCFKAGYNLCLDF